VGGIRVNISKERVMAEASSTGFRPEMLEKVIRLLDLLNELCNHTFLKDRLALKGGTALNVFEFDLPRLSVDIDLNYVGSADTGTMKRERPDIEKAIADVCNRAGIQIDRMPGDHAGGKWRLRYNSALGGGANLELDLNFMLRVPLWPIAFRDSKRVGSFSANRIPLMDINELASGKLAALLSRHTARDLFDAHELLTKTAFNTEQLRLGFVIYGASNRKDWRTVSPDDVGFDAEDLQQSLVPVLSNRAIEGIGDSRQWARRLVEGTQQGLARLLPLSPPEREFLDRLLDHGEIQATLLTKDDLMAAKIARLPLLQWKALNVREHIR
jgi:predicted nucleotidyltransferase component of viral defense system